MIKDGVKVVLAIGLVSTQRPMLKSYKHRSFISTGFFSSLTSLFSCFLNIVVWIEFSS